MDTAPNADDFSADEKPRAFQAWIEVRARVRVDIDADSIDDARAKAAQLALDMESNPYDVEIDEVDHANVMSVRKSPTMYRVTRDGETMQVSRLMPGDVPREPNARGF